MFENLLFNLFNLIGVGTSYKKNNFTFIDGDYEMMVANPDGFMVNPEMCLSQKCRKCENDCKLCLKCLSSDEKYDLIQAYRETMNIGDFKRLFPPKKEFMEKVGEEFYSNLLEENKMLVDWFDGMCKKNRRFC